MGRFTNFTEWFARAALALIFIWFGALKLAGVSPVVDVITKAVPFLTKYEAMYTALGIFEVALGLAILIPAITRVASWVMVAHLAFATASVLKSAQSFNGGFPALSVVGEFVIKNFALIAVALFLLVCRPKKKN